MNLSKATGVRTLSRTALRRLIVLAALLAVALCDLAATARHHLAQSQSTAKDPAASTLPTYEFDVVSIKPIDPNSTDPGGTTFEPNRIVARNISLWWLIRMAYGAQHGEVFQTPGWIDDVRFNFEARTDDETTAAIQKLSKEHQELARQQMLRSMLADRFKFAAHRESRELPAFLLTLSADGPKLQPSKSSATDEKKITDVHGNPLAALVAFEMRGGGGGTEIVVTGQSASAGELAAQLSRRMSRPVIDKTGLSGVYAFTFRCFVEASLSAGGEASAATYENPCESRAFSNAMEGAIGLKLAPGKGSINTLVIDHVERPSPN